MCLRIKINKKNRTFELKLIKRKIFVLFLFIVLFFLVEIFVHLLYSLFFGVLLFFLIEMARLNLYVKKTQFKKNTIRKTLKDSKSSVITEQTKPKQKAGNDFSCS